MSLNSNIPKIDMRKRRVIQVDKRQNEIDILGSIIKILIFIEINLIILALYVAFKYGI